ncbi:hypothetical protein PG985_007784 [Apiospora marii]|uniref:Uncharacterized protein n=1 Tax=Apiospora marii TaxID=335849 RepID=A0ABR1SQ48_9PEZI
MWGSGIPNQEIVAIFTELSNHYGVVGDGKGHQTRLRGRTPPSANLLIRYCGTAAPQLSLFCRLAVYTAWAPARTSRTAEDDRNGTAFIRPSSRPNNAMEESIVECACRLISAKPDKDPYANVLINLMPTNLTLMLSVGTALRPARSQLGVVVLKRGLVQHRRGQQRDHLGGLINIQEYSDARQRYGTLHGGLERIAEHR